MTVIKFFIEFCVNLFFPGWKMALMGNWKRILDVLLFQQIIIVFFSFLISRHFLSVKAGIILGGLVYIVFLYYVTSLGRYLKAISYKNPIFNLSLFFLIFQVFTLGREFILVDNQWRIGYYLVKSKLMEPIYKDGSIIIYNVRKVCIQCLNPLKESSAWVYKGEDDELKIGFVVSYGEKELELNSDYEPQVEVLLKDTSKVESVNIENLKGEILENISL